MNQGKGPALTQKRAQRSGGISGCPRMQHNSPSGQQVSLGAEPPSVALSIISLQSAAGPRDKDGEHFDRELHWRNTTNTARLTENRSVQRAAAYFLVVSLTYSGSYILNSNLTLARKLKLLPVQACSQVEETRQDVPWRNHSFTKAPLWQ